MANRDVKIKEIHKQVERYRSAVTEYDWTSNEFLGAVVNAVYASGVNNYPNHEDLDAITALTEQVFADAQVWESVF
jgi:spermidine synthase